MTDHELPTGDRTERDHWDIYADCMDLTIEGHRLIAQEIMCEVKLLWRSVTGWWHGASSRRTAP